MSNLPIFRTQWLEPISNSWQTSKNLIYSSCSVWIRSSRLSRPNPLKIHVKTKRNAADSSRKTLGCWLLPTIASLKSWPYRPILPPKLSRPAFCKKSYKSSRRAASGKSPSWMSSGLRWLIRIGRSQRNWMSWLGPIRMARWGRRRRWSELRGKLIGLSKRCWKRQDRKGVPSKKRIKIWGMPYRKRHMNCVKCNKSLCASKNSFRLRNETPLSCNKKNRLSRDSCRPHSNPFL